ncbi:MAG TPA: hypothetical protein H9913_01750 [Candidatus Blautia stercoripullorum]|uniref:Lipoprotein n=1 Tax=Candidatus Blautia stercoripullorum TaxID=2838502 RepID=A0A9D2R7E6_9FIRM|nr:hypothetical protein [Candidatus Blautia stercoripullorum]
MKLRIAAVLLMAAVLGAFFTGCKEKDEEGNLELVQVCAGCSAVWTNQI